MRLKKRFEITKRGYDVLKQYCPGLISAKVCASALKTLLPYIVIWTSAKVVNEISNDARITMLAVYVLIAICSSLVFSMIISAFQKVTDEKESAMWNYFPKIFADKQMSMDFADLEDQDIQKQRQKAEENLFMFGNGLAQLVWDTAGLVSVIVGLAASIALTASLFISRSGDPVMDSYLWLIPGAAVLMFAGFCTSGLKKKEQKVFDEWMEGSVWYNRAFKFYGHEIYAETERAMDARIYAHERIADREISKINEHKKTDKKYYSGMSGCQALLVFANGICNALCYIFVVVKASYGAFEVGNIVQYVGALTLLVQSFGELVNADSENRIYTAHLEKLFDYLDIPNKKQQGTLKVEGVSGHCIEFKNVSFKYPGSDVYVLKNINAKIDMGKKQAFVGANGAGKSTFVKLLCRLYDPDEGVILLDGKDIREYEAEEYLKLFSFVFQDFKLFSFPLGQNLAADTAYDKEKAEDCIKKVSQYDRLQSMKDGMDTYLYKDISPDGIDVSGGEAQKIALARALYKDAPIIVLDEPTAALDPIAEAKVYSDFSDLVKDKTAVYISHRLSSCRFCDEILVFENGEIVQKGNHDELVKITDGKYYELWNAQAQYYASPN